jgi:hypothetical protein
LAAKKMHCSNCKYPFEKHTGVKPDDKPKMGDFSVCFRCGIIYVFNEDLTLHLASPQELKQLFDNNQQAFMKITQLSEHIKQRMVRAK